jgi:phosphate starvation-inducible membrane PsiE
MTTETFYVILAIIIGILGYFHYIIDKQKKEIDILWTQIAILAASVAKKLTEYESKQINDGEK